jgi:penicillin-insensitive murein endopeptidase
VRHVRGHGNHIHIRFHSPVAEALGVRLARALPRPDPRPASAVASSAPAGHAPVGTNFAQLRARSGDTLVVWAKRYGTSVEDIQRANGLTTTALKIGNVYKIPQKPPPLPPPSKTVPAKAPVKPAPASAKKPLPRLPAGLACLARPQVSPRSTCAERSPRKSPLPARRC